MKCLVTGGAGFIGSNLTKYLIDKGHDVTVIDDFSSSGRQKVDPRALLIKGSISNDELLNKHVSNKDVVFHLAATGIIKKSIEDLYPFFVNNLINGIKLLEAMRKFEVKKIIYSSSSEVYGDTKNSVIKEDDPKEPINPYGATKYALENALSSYYHSFGIESTSLRYYNIYGPGDEQHPVTRVIPKWVKGAINDEPITLYWGGRQKKDYVYVDDVLRANLLAAENTNGFSVYNVGSGQPITMLNIAQILEKVLGKNLNFQNMDERLGNPEVLVADIYRIKKELDWAPQVNLEEGLKYTIEYYDSGRNLP